MNLASISSTRSSSTGPGARNINPSSISFVSAFKSLLINNFCAPHSVGANCEEESDTEGALDCLRNFLEGPRRVSENEEVPLNYGEQRMTDLKPVNGHLMLRLHGYNEVATDFECEYPIEHIQCV